MKYRSVCTKNANGASIMGVCPATAKFGAWETALTDLSNKALGVDYSTVKCSVHDTSGLVKDEDAEPLVNVSSACCVCRAIAIAADKHLHTMKTSDFDGINHVKQLLIRDAVPMCETVRLSVPMAETRMELVKSTLGRACIQWSHQVDRKDLEEAVAGRRNLEDALCVNQCEVKVAKGAEKHREL
jgi:hypothetical protein